MGYCLYAAKHEVAFVSGMEYVVKNDTVYNYVITCLLVIIFSKRAVRPAIESYEKQRQFITDAGHEIKTPLAIISANTEVIEMTGEETEWTRSIRNQVARLDGLVKDLLHLSRMEEGDVKLVFCDFDMSKAVTEAAQPFEALAKTNSETLELDVAQGIMMNGDEASVRQLTSILVENAVKYAEDNSVIKVALTKTASGRHSRRRTRTSCSTDSTAVMHHAAVTVKRSADTA